jgi:hypothetical protein
MFHPPDRECDFARRTKGAQAITRSAFTLSAAIQITFSGHVDT